MDGGGWFFGGPVVAEEEKKGRQRSALELDEATRSRGTYLMADRTFGSQTFHIKLS